MRPSILQDDAEGVTNEEGGSQNPISFGVHNIIDRKVDRIDMNEALATRASKKDTEMIHRMIVILHKQLK